MLTEFHMNHDQIHHVRNNWLGAIFSSPEDIHTKGLLVLLNPPLEGVTEVYTDPGQRLMSFKVTPSNNRPLCVYTPVGHNTREQLARGHEGLQNYMENKTEGNENKILLGDFNCTKDKMGRHGGNKPQRLYRFDSNYTLSKLIVDNGIEDL